MNSGRVFIKISQNNFDVIFEEIDDAAVLKLKKIFPQIKVSELSDSKYEALIKTFDINSLRSLEEDGFISHLKKLINNLDSFPTSMKIGNRIFDFSKQAYIMGIVNITPDSFYDGGRYFDLEKAKQRIKECYEEGADMIDIGGESTRPGSIRISEEEELRRILPLVEYAKKEFDIPISVDTYKSRVAEECIALGADLINDVTGLVGDLRMAEIARKYDIPIVLMHLRGNPRIMQKDIHYQDVVIDVLRSLYVRIDYAKQIGIKESKIIIDPGIGFGKTVEQNVELILRLKELKIFGLPILVGISRKSFLGKILDLPVEERLEASLAALVLAVINGANIARVHDIKESVRVAKLSSFFRNKLYTLK
ncbi:MAG TPA: dihydropteroate synthase [Geobacterales bacterium]|nr:dihydropteroate synthase [Geobacterales bacterium]